MQLVHHLHLEPGFVTVVKSREKIVLQNRFIDVIWQLTSDSNEIAFDEQVDCFVQNTKIFNFVLRKNIPELRKN